MPAKPVADGAFPPYGFRAMADENAHYYEPSDGHGLRYDPFNSIIAPRPIGWISTISAAGVPNLAPYSFFNALNYHPPLIGFSSVGWKDSVANIEATGVFCWNLANRPHAEAMNASSASVPAETDEFVVAGLTKASSRLVSAPRVLESPVNFECRLSELIRLRTADGKELDSWFVIGEVVAVHMDKNYIVNGAFDGMAAQPIMRGGGPDEYFAIDAGARFRMRRPD